MRNNVQEGERKKEIGRLSSAHKIRRPRDSNEYISYRREICYTLEKRYPGYVYHLPPAHVQQYVPEANQIWQSGSSPSSLVNQPISKGREREHSSSGKNRGQGRGAERKRPPRESKVRYVSYIFRSETSPIYSDGIWTYRVCCTSRTLQILSEGSFHEPKLRARWISVLENSRISEKYLTLRHSCEYSEQS